MSKKRVIHNWGKPLAVIGLVFGILALACGTLSTIPLIGLTLAAMALVLGAIAMSFCIPGIFGSYSIRVGVVGLIFGATMVIWGLIRIFWLLYLIA